MWCWPRRNRITRRGKRMIRRPAFHYLAEDDEDQQASGGLHQLVSRGAGGAPSVWKKVTAGAAEDVKPRSMFPDISTEEVEYGKGASCVRMQQTNFFMAGEVSVEDRPKRTEILRPQWVEHSGKQPESDSALSATSDGNDFELNGETDDEDVEDDDGSAEQREHMTTQPPYRSW